MTKAGETVRADVAVIGAGVCGLFIGYKLARLGFDVVIVEAADRVASGSSSRNEGWLHSGTYHAGAIADRSRSIRVARNCAYGHQQIRALAPEALSPSSPRSVALVRDRDRAQEAESRWREAGMDFRGLDPGEARGLLPEVDFSAVHRSYLVGDCGIDTRMLHRVLLSEATLRGARLLLRHTFRYASTGTAVVEGEDGSVRPLRARFVVLATGYLSGGILESRGVTLPLRLWKSHILYGPQLTGVPVFWLDPDEATLMNHPGRVSVIGLNEDAHRIHRVDLDVDVSRAQAVRKALTRLAPHASPSSFSAQACLKVDLAREEEPRSVEMQVSEPAEDTFLALPGKLTEAPALADDIARVLVQRTGAPQVARRPWDARPARGGAGDQA